MNKDSLKLAQSVSNLIWSTYDDKFFYASEKMERNKGVSIENPDNIWFFWNQFDHDNQYTFTKLVTCLPSDRPGVKEMQEFVNKNYLGE